MTTSRQTGIGTRITRYGTILAVSGILCKIMLLVYTVLAVRILGQEQFGRIEYFIEMAIIFCVLIDFGLEQTITRELSRKRAYIQNHLYSLFLFRLAVTCLGSVLMAVILKILAQPGHTWSLIVASLTYFFISTLNMLVRAVVRSVELMTYEGIANVLDKVVHISLALLLLAVLPSLPLIILCYTAGGLISFLIYLYVLFKEFNIVKKPILVRDWIDWQKLAFPIGLSAACILLLHREDTAMVNWIQGDEETGLYRAPYRFLEGLFLFPQVIAISAYPIFSKLFHENQPFQHSAAGLMKGMVLLSLPIAIGGSCVAQEMMMWLTPELGPEGGTIFLILLWSLPFIYLNFLLGTILNATNRQNLNVRASAIGLIGNAALNVPAIYWCGALGASVVTILSQGLYCLMMIVYTRDFGLFTHPSRYAAIFLSCGLMAAALVWLRQPWYFEIPVGAVLYGILLVVSRGLSYRDLQNLRRVFSGKE